MLRANLGPRFFLIWMTVSLLDLNLAHALAESAAAQAAFQKKAYNKSIELLSPRLVDLDKTDILLLARSHEFLGNHNASLKVLSTARSKFPQDVEIAGLYGRSQFLSGHRKEAILSLKELIEKHPQYLPAYRTLVEIFSDAKDRAQRYELRLLYQDMVEKFGEKPDFITPLCRLDAAEGLYDVALKNCLLGTQISPKTAENWVHLGTVYKDTGKPELAESTLQKAAKAFPDSEIAQLGLAKFYEDKKNILLSYKHYVSSVKANNKSVEGLIGVGQTSAELQKMDESISAFSKACKLDRSALPAFRKTANTLRLAKNEVWLKKFEAAIDKCN